MKGAKLPESERVYKYTRFNEETGEFNPHIQAPLECLIELRKLLFKNGLSLSEFYAQVVRMSLVHHAAIIEIMDAAKKTKAKKGVGRLYLNTTTLYDVIESKSPFTQGAEDDVEEDSE